MYDRNYAYTRRFEGTDYATVVAKVRAELPNHGFGAITEIDVQATLKAKLDIDRKPYLILGACNPKVANDAINAEAGIGVFLPCNITIFEGEDGAIYVQSIDPKTMFSLIDNPGVAPMAEVIGGHLQSLLNAL